MAKWENSSRWLQLKREKTPWKPNKDIARQGESKDKKGGKTTAVKK